MLIITFCALFEAFVTELIAAPAASILPPGMSHYSPESTVQFPQSFMSEGLVSHADDVEEEYKVAMRMGQRLLAATTLGHDAANHFIPIDSPWINPIQYDLTTRGYKFETDDGTPQWRASHSDDCEFQYRHRLKTMFDSLSIPTRSTWWNGPNRCYCIYHRNGPAIFKDINGNLPPVESQWYQVGNRLYRVSAKQMLYVQLLTLSHLQVTNAEFKIGVNVMSGVIVMMKIQSPARSAQNLWNLPQPPPDDQLPALRASSDIMWGLWKMENPHHPWDIKLFLSTPVLDHHTTTIIEKILQTKHLQLNSLMVYPGLELESTEPQYLPLLCRCCFRYVSHFLKTGGTDSGCQLSITQRFCGRVLPRALPRAAQEGTRRHICIEDQYS